MSVPLGVRLRYYMPGKRTNLSAPHEHSWRCPRFSTLYPSLQLRFHYQRSLIPTHYMMKLAHPVSRTSPQKAEPQDVRQLAEILRDLIQAGVPVSHIEPVIASYISTVLATKSNGAMPAAHTQQRLHDTLMALVARIRAQVAAQQAQQPRPQPSTANTTTSAATTGTALAPRVLRGPGADVVTRAAHELPPSPSARLTARAKTPALGSSHPELSAAAQRELGVTTLASPGVEDDAATRLGALDRLLMRVEDSIHSTTSVPQRKPVPTDAEAPRSSARASQLLPSARAAAFAPLSRHSEFMPDVAMQYHDPRMPFINFMAASGVPQEMATVLRDDDTTLRGQHLLQQGQPAGQLVAGPAQAEHSQPGMPAAVGVLPVSPIRAAVRPPPDTWVPAGRSPVHRPAAPASSGGGAVPTTTPAAAEQRPATPPLGPQGPVGDLDAIQTDAFVRAAAAAAAAKAALAAAPAPAPSAHHAIGSKTADLAELRQHMGLHSSAVPNARRLRTTLHV